MMTTKETRLDLWEWQVSITLLEKYVILQVNCI